MSTSSFRRSAVLAGLVIAGSGARGFAQTPTLPVDRIGSCGVPAIGDKIPTAALTEAYETGNWTAFVTAVKAVRDAVPLAKEKDCATVGIGPRDHVFVVWLGKSHVGGTALRSAVVPPTGGEPFAARLPGISGDGVPKLYQVFVADKATDALAAAYLSTREKNPLLTQIPDVAAAILGPLLTTIKGVMKARLDEATDVTPAAAGWATVSRVPLPFDRATVKVAMKATVAASADRLKGGAKDLARELRLIGARHSAPARTLAARLAAIVDASAATCVAPDFDCLENLDKRFADEFAALRPQGGAHSEDDLEAMRLVDTKFRALVDTQDAKELSGSAVIKNAPLTKLSFGLMTALSFGRTFDKPRAKVDDGVLADDPLDRQVNMVVLNSAFRAYDADMFAPTRAEMWRWYAGAVVSPAFGLGGGVSFLPLRGLGINFGYAVMWVSAPKGDDSIGGKPSDPDDPLGLSPAGTWLFGLSYNFK